MCCASIPRVLTGSTSPCSSTSLPARTVLAGSSGPGGGTNCILLDNGRAPTGSLQKNELYGSCDWWLDGDSTSLGKFIFRSAVNGGSHRRGDKSPPHTGAWPRATRPCQRHSDPLRASHHRYKTSSISMARWGGTAKVDRPFHWDHRDDRNLHFTRSSEKVIGEVQCAK